MSGGSNKQQMRQLLVDAITMLCKNGLQYQAEVTIDGLLALTVDQEQVIVVPIRETIKRKQTDSPTRCNTQSPGDCKNTDNDTDQGRIKLESSSRKRRRKISLCSVENQPSPDLVPIPVSIKQEVVSDNDSDGGGLEDFGFRPSSQASSDGPDTSCNDISTVQDQPLSQWPDTEPEKPSGLMTKEDAPMRSELAEGAVAEACMTCGGPVSSEALQWSGFPLCMQCIPTSSMLEGVGNLNTSLHPMPDISDDKQNLCPLCGKEFSAKSSLREHINNIHMKTKKFACPYPGCGSSFARKQHYHSHLNVHEGSKPFQCIFCHVSFSGKQGLDRHARLCRQIRCDVCQLSFPTPQSMEEHKTSSHPV